MKIVYLANALPHYFSPLLNKLNSQPDVELVVVAPMDTSHYAATGVYETTENINFRCIKLPEYHAGRYFDSFKGLVSLLWRERPDIVMMADNNFRAFIFHPGLALSRRVLRIAPILKAIPFEVPDLQASKDEISRLVRGIPSAPLRAKLARALKAAHRLLALWLRRKRYQGAAAHVVYIDEGRAFYSSYGVPVERVFVTRNSPDTDGLEAAEARIAGSARMPARAPRGVLFVGRLVKQKRPDLLVRAFRTLLDEFADATLTFVGNGPEQSALVALVDGLHMSHAVTFVGGVYDPVELGRQFMSNSLFVLPGLGGLSINEAMFYRMPILCARGDGTERHLVRSGWNGSFFAEDNEQDLAQKMIKLIRDTDRLRSMGEHSREIIDREVNVHTVAAEYRRAFDYAVCQR